MHDWRFVSKPTGFCRVQETEAAGGQSKEADRGQHVKAETLRRMRITNESALDLSTHHRVTIALHLVLDIVQVG